MFEALIPGTRYGEGVIDSDTAYCGCLCYIAGVNSTGQAVLRLPGSTTNAIKARWFVNKYYFAEDLSDSSDDVDKLTNGDSIVYYGDGEYLTDKVRWYPVINNTAWAAAEDVSTVGGRQQYVPGSNTALATKGRQKVYACTSKSSEKGFVCFASSDNSAVYGQVSLTDTTNAYLGFLTGIYYKDSANAYARVRIAPGNRSRF